MRGRNIAFAKRALVLRKAALALRQGVQPLFVGALALAISASAIAQTKMIFYTNWFAQAEHGGFYQAQAQGLYKKHGLEVEIKMGGPQVNGLQLLAAGQMDVFMGYDIQTLGALEQGVPLVTVAATFQKDPAVIISHPGPKRVEDLKGKPIFIGPASNTTFWPWLVARYGFSDAQKRPYAFSVQPFLADKTSSQQGYVTSEPYSVEKGGVKPTVFLLADLGYPPYAQTLVTTRTVLEKKRKEMQSFIQASAEGWKSYLADPAAGNLLIKKDNPQMEDELIAYGIRKMKEYSLVSGGDAAKLGIMTMSDDRWRRTHEFMVSAKLLKAETDYRRGYTLDLVRAVKVLP
ncbi:MAG: ABC transporter substrate-binding protein [Burkholderiales bacterium]